MKAIAWVKPIVLSGVAVVTILAPGYSQAATNGPRDCDTNAVIYCGAYTKAELKQKLEQGDSRHTATQLQQVMFKEGRGISLAAIMSGDTVEGVATKDGRIYVNGKVVATNARSTGRHQMTGSVRSGSLWLTPNSTAFKSDRIETLVNMQGGQFRWAIIKSCGNTVVASAVKATPTPTPTPTATPTPTPTPVVTPTPTPTPPAPVATPPVLPGTGAESLLGGSVGIGAMGLLARRYWTSRREVIQAVKRK